MDYVGEVTVKNNDYYKYEFVCNSLTASSFLLAATVFRYGEPQFRLGGAVINAYAL